MFRIKIGPFTTEIRISPKGFEAGIKEILSGFLCADKPDIILNARLVDGLRYNDFKGPSPATRISKDIYHIKWYYFSGEYNTSTGEVNSLINNKPYLLTSLLRMVYDIKAIFSNGLFVHAASFTKDNKGYLFPGISGAGKSTLARIASKADKNITILSDEISYISFEKGRVLAYSTPFWGNTSIRGRYISVPLKNIYFIKQSKRNYKKEIDVKNAMHCMLENVLYASLENEGLHRSLSSLQKILKITGNYILYFTRDAKFLEVI